MVASSLISVKVRSITSRNSFADLNSAIRGPVYPRPSAAKRPPAQTNKFPAVTDPIHLHPTAPLAQRVLLPGDPGRALLLAQAVLTEPKMFNHNRGLWGYTGIAPDGEPLTIQSTGMGGPSAAIVISELDDLGARTLLRTGTCGAVHPALELGQLLVVTEAIAEDGTSRALGAPARVSADAELMQRLIAAGDGRLPIGPVVSTDLFYDAPAGTEQRWLTLGARAVEMEAATLFALAARRGLRAGALLIVTDVLLPERQRIDAEALRAAELRLGELAAAALASGP
jgi:uridine phosphorylase